MTATIVFAPDSFKGSASATAAARALAAGWASVRPHDTAVLKPMADGGEGTIDAFAAGVPGARRMPVTVTGPDDRALSAEWLLLPDGTAVVELANTSGMTLLDSLRPVDAHTRGFGQAVVAALAAGAEALVLAIGGSSSTDGGSGALSALGARFLAADGTEIPGGNGGLALLDAVDFSGISALPRGGVSVLCDVTNPLLGASGAAAVFGPQKGASTPGLVVRLDSGLERLAAVLGPARQTDPSTPGAGAAGGTGFGLLSWGATLTPGAAEVARLSRLAEAIRGSDAVVTGEGRFDSQSAAGKVPSQVLAAAAGSSAQPLLVAGQIAAPVDAFARAVSLSDLAGGVAAARADALRWLEAAGARLAAGFEG